MEKCVVFEAKSNYARFRKAYTTTSALTYLSIHPIAVSGLIGAILGIDRNELYEYTKDFKIGVQVINKIQKDMQSFNLLNMKYSDKFFRFPSNVEFIRNPHYKIFVKGDNKKISVISQMIKIGEFVFTPYLGASEHIAKINYIGEYVAEKLEKGIHMIDTAIDVENVEIDFNEIDYFINTDNIPIKNNESREYIKYKKIMFCTNNQKIKGITENCYKVGEYNVIFL